jgi:hypothetical protein
MALIYIILAVVIAIGVLAVMRSSRLTREAAGESAHDSAAASTGAGAKSANKNVEEPRKKRGGCC